MPGGRFRVLAGRLLLRTRLRRSLPADGRQILDRLRSAGYEAWLVGGCVRDLVLGRRPKDWDITTNASVEQLQALFPEGRCMGQSRQSQTVLIPLAGTGYEVTPYRGRTLAEDLGRRDFTFNAMAVSPEGVLADPMGGLADLARGLIRACGDARVRMGEDPLRMLRAVRLAAELQFEIGAEVTVAIREQSPELAVVAPERLGSEFARLLVSGRPAWAVERLREYGLLAVIAPELLEMVGVEQNEYHAFPVWEHALLALSLVPPLLVLRLAALFHDIGKPHTVTVDEAGRRHFYSHELVGAALTQAVLQRLRLDRETQQRVVHLVRYHMDMYFDGDVSDAAIRRMINRIGREHMDDLIQLRRADRLASGMRTGDLAPETVELLQRVKAILAGDAALKITDLKVNGDDVLRVFGRPPGPYVREILSQLLEEVMEDPSHNDRDWLLERLDVISRL